MRLLTTLLTLAIIAGVSGHTQVASAKQESSTAATKLQHSYNVLRFFDNHSWLKAPRQEKCKQVPWRHSCVIARKLVRLHSARVKTLKREMWYSLPYTGDWRTAVSLAQRPYPGTADWLLFISHREGGYGPFVMNHQGSGAGGWMQFMAGTFYGYNDAAASDLRRRGFDIPSNVMVWTHPLGQALTAGYMRYYHKDGCHWCL